MNSMKPKAVIFDLDGTLIDSFETAYRAFAQILKDFGVRPPSRSEYRKLYWGRFAGDNYRKALGISGEDLEELLKRHVKKSVEFSELLRPNPYAKKLLTRLRSQGIKLALVTSTLRKITISHLKRMGLRKYFDVVICGDDLTKRKPDPEPILEACRRLRVKPSDCIYVGDLEVDEEAARRAGIGRFIRVRRKVDLLKLLGMRNGKD